MVTKSGKAASLTANPLARTTVCRSGWRRFSSHEDDGSRQRRMDSHQRPADQLLPGHLGYRCFDTGRWNRRGDLHIDPSVLDGVEKVTVALSHFHLDHLIGLAFVSVRWLADREVTIAGPGAMSYGCPTRSIVEGRLLDAPLQTVSPLASARWAELGRDLLSFAGHEVQVWEQTRHDLPSLGFRIGDHLAYCTDTEFDPQTIRHVAGVTTLLHEA